MKPLEPVPAATPIGHSPTTSLTLLVRLQAHQPEAWERLVDLYGPLVYHWCRRANLGPEDAADTFQEVFRAVAEHIERFRRDRPSDTFRGWLRIITSRKILDHFRRQENQPRAEGGTDAQQRLQAAPDPIPNDDPSEDHVLQAQVRRILESLQGDFEPRTWQAFWQVQMENRDTATVAAELCMSVPAVRKAKFRVLARLRQELVE